MEVEEECNDILDNNQLQVYVRRGIRRKNPERHLKFRGK